MLLGWSAFSVWCLILFLFEFGILTCLFDYELFGVRLDLVGFDCVCFCACLGHWFVYLGLLVALKILGCDLLVCDFMLS